MNYKNLANQLKQAYLQSHIAIDLLWEAYVILCQKGWRDNEPLTFCDWQWTDTRDFLTNHKQMFLDWCRFSGKTEKGSLLAVFFTILGLDALWFVKATNQFMRVQRLWNCNPFVEFHKANRQRKEVQLVTGDLITLEVLLTEENCSGPHPKIIFYDEFALMDLKLMAKANLMLGEDPWIMYISTPVLGSPTTTIRTQVTTRTHTYLECQWKNPKQMEKLKIRGMEWMWEQDMMCKEILPQGAVFPNVSHTYVFPEIFDKTSQGVDFNGMANKNILVRIGRYGGQVYILKEEAFAYKFEDAILQSRVLEFATEVESGGYNDIFAPQLTGVTKVCFNGDQGALKIERIKEILKQIVYINPDLCPKLLDDLRHAFWKADGKVDTSQLHYLSALMHAIGVRPRYLEVAGNTAIVKQDIQRQKEVRARILTSHY